MTVNYYVAAKLRKNSETPCIPLLFFYVIVNVTIFFTYRGFGISDEITVKVQRIIRIVICQVTLTVGDRLALPLTHKVSDTS
jgi:hypothetical protein